MDVTTSHRWPWGCGLHCSIPSLSFHAAIHTDIPVSRLGWEQPCSWPFLATSSAQSHTAALALPGALSRGSGHGSLEVFAQGCQ